MQNQNSSGNAEMGGLGEGRDRMWFLLQGAHVFACVAGCWGILGGIYTLTVGSTAFVISGILRM